uniref:Uncharacterized protein n=1 Tax=uncultured Caudovirales phage TaxID=2100421 RepID=A0A6J5LAA9_9CAUD|nr:hypothetical protein UFOVP114_71 [uncultured Caudovirales phage]
MKYEQARNVVTLLQSDPLAYRRFGVWWYHVKKQLKRHGFDDKMLAHLGNYTDAAATAHYKGLSEQDLDDQAFDAQAAQQFEGASSGWGFSPDGEQYHLLDEDVE